MIPNAFLQIDNFPLTINHKIDRKALPNIEIQKEVKEIIKPKTKTEKLLCKIISMELGIDEIGINEDIFNYQVDSLTIIKIQTKLLSYNCKINTQNFYDNKTIKSIAQSIKISNNENDNSQYKNINKSFIKLTNNIELKENIYGTILLTGVTGFLGIHILYDLLKNTSNDVVCIVRASDDINAKQRLTELFKFYFNDFCLDFNRITILKADIKSANFGLNNKDYECLLHKINLVINTVANVRYYGNYNDFQEINVKTLENIIAFCISGDIMLSHISTLGLSGNYLVRYSGVQNTFTENDFYIGQNFKDNVYIHTKFDAEALIYNNISKGLKASIFRVGNLTSRYSDGHFQKNIENNAFYNILTMILKYNILPKSMLNQNLEFTPVDLCSLAIVKLIFNADINRKVFHLFNNNYISVEKLLECFSRLGYVTQIVTGHNFTETMLLKSNIENNNILKGMVNDIDKDSGLTFKANVMQENNLTNQYLSNLNFKWENVDYYYIEKIIKYLKENNNI